MDRLKGKVAVVTGAGRGLGRHIALAMAAEGARVIVNDLGVALNGTGHSGAPAEEVVNRIQRAGGEARANFSSVADPDGAESIIKEALNSFGRIDILVNNAGIRRDNMIWDMTDEEWDTLIKTHLYGCFYCTRAAVKWMRDAAREGQLMNGRIINFTSGAGMRGHSEQPNYCAAKMGIVGFTYSCAMDLGRQGITCNAIYPRGITRLAEVSSEDSLRAAAVRRGALTREEARRFSIDEIKRRLLGRPEAVAPVVCWLASDESRLVNGHVFLATEGKLGIYNPMDEAKVAFKDGIFTLDEIWRIMPIMTAGLPYLSE